MHRSPWLLGFQEFVLWFDPAASVVCCLILCMCILLVAFENVFILLLAVPKAVDLSDIESRLQKAFPNAAIHRLHIWSEGRSFLNLSVHFRLKSADLYEEHAEALRQFFQSYGIHHIVLQPEFEDQVDGKRTGCLFEMNDTFCNESDKL
ncbi:unnamed protein product [Soboliphyme baturini]|uniref:Zinc transporter ZIP8 n=1 Tax=Soboliphyme baturini TaxID=241478 RepID=A0A183IT90_9BILA|nr:unnamed protein product [Soboliphyme baturini]